MPARAGILMLIKAGDGGMPETYTTIGGLQTTQLAINNQTLDASNADSGQWQKLLTNAGISRITIRGNGIFTDVQSEENVRAYAFASSINNYQFYFANGDYLTGAFLISSYERRGDHDAEEIYALTLESAGAVTYTHA